MNFKTIFFNKIREKHKILYSPLATDPEIYKLDTLRKNNRGNIRAYEKHTYRISYLIEKEAVYVIRVRYARKEPLEY